MEIRQFIPYATPSITSSTPDPDPDPCIHCHIPRLPDCRGNLCDVCWSMLEAIATPYFRSIQKEWWAENDLLIAKKARLLQADGGDFDPAY